MVISYQNTFEEYVEAYGAIVARRTQKKKRSNIIIFLIAGWLIGSYILAQVLNLPDRAMLVFQCYIPVLLIVIDVFAVQLLMALFRKSATKLNPRALLGVLPLLIVTGVWIAFFAIDRQVHPTSYSADWYLRLLVPHATWFVLLTAALVADSRKKRKGLATAWEGQPTLHRAKTAEIVANGITTRDPTTTCQYSWDAFLDWQETKNLFLFYPSQFHVVFLPKKAFKSEDELSALRALAEQIPGVENRGFPLHAPSISTPPPLPSSAGDPVPPGPSPG